jgi:hypothetical protein
MEVEKSNEPTNPGKDIKEYSIVILFCILFIWLPLVGYILCCGCLGRGGERSDATRAISARANTSAESTAALATISSIP